MEITLVRSQIQPESSITPLHYQSLVNTKQKLSPLKFAEWRSKISFSSLDVHGMHFSLCSVWLYLSPLPGDSTNFAFTDVLARTQSQFAPIGDFYLEMEFMHILITAAPLRGENVRNISAPPLRSAPNNVLAPTTRKVFFLFILKNISC